MSDMAKVAYQFQSVDDFKRTFKSSLPKPYDWRLIEPMVGEINGIPTSRGIAIATNGIIVAIMQNDGVVFGHLDWFVKDKEQPICASKLGLTVKSSSTKISHRKTSKLFDTF